MRGGACLRAGKRSRPAIAAVAALAGRDGSRDGDTPYRGIGPHRGPQASRARAPSHGERGRRIRSRRPADRASSGRRLVANACGARTRACCRIHGAAHRNTRRARPDTGRAPGAGRSFDAPRPEEIARARSRRPVRLQPCLSRCRAPAGRVSDAGAPGHRGRCSRTERPAHRLDRQRCRHGASRARRREHRAARLRWQGIPRTARHGRRLAAGRSGRWIRERHSRCDPVHGRYFLRAWRRFDGPARNRARLDGARESGRREHQPGRREEHPADRSRARD